VAKKCLTIGQKKTARDQQKAKGEVKLKAGADRIDTLLAELNKGTDGRTRIFRSSDIEKREWSRRRSGCLSLDVVLNGGLPRGGLVEFGGPYSSGKTTLALHCCAHEQKTYGGAVAWIALEPFSKRWARECGFFIPFSENTTLDPVSGEETPIDSYEQASELELLRMQQAGIEDPYTEVSPFVLVQEERGDVALDVALDLIASNEFAYVVVDSLGVAKNTKWVEEKGVQEAGDFPREPKMLGDYTARALLKMNAKYDENNRISGEGTRFNDTTVININQIVTNIGSMANSPWKMYEMKGGEGMKHNHHAVVFVWRTMRQDQVVDAPGGKRYNFAQQINMYGLKSKLGPPFLQGETDFYLRPYGEYQPGDFDTAGDVLTWGTIAGTIERTGAWYHINGEKFNGRPAAEAYLNENHELLWSLYESTLMAMRK